MSAAALRMILLRSAGTMSRQTSKPFCAACRARSRSARPACATRPISLPVEGFITGSVLPSAGACHWPLMKSCVSTYPMSTPSAVLTMLPLDVEAKMDHVAVAHDVVLAFDPELAGLLRALLAAARDVVVIADDLGADEAALEIGVDNPRRLRRGGAGANRPGTRFLRAGGEVGLQAEQAVRGADHAGEPGFLHAHVVEKDLLVFVAQVG